MRKEINELINNNMTSKFKSFLNKLTSKDSKPKQSIQISKKKKLDIAGFFYLTDHIIISPFPDEDSIEEIADYLN